ncbi:hypothetical protein A2U01_0058755, partial [Trifolium medium]|nr:hypothetical protein [Trifolium medium]
MRLMKEGVIITGDDIAKVSPVKRKRILKDKQEIAAEEDNTATETVATGTEGASEAQTNKGKEPVASASKDNPVSDKPEGKVIKKKRTLKGRAEKITIVSDSEDTEEEQPLSKR